MVDYELIIRLFIQSYVGQFYPLVGIAVFAKLGRNISFPLN